MNKEDYWKNKELRDIKKDRQISRHGALNTAIEICKLLEEKDIKKIQIYADKVLEYVNK